MDVGCLSQFEVAVVNTTEHPCRSATRSARSNIKKGHRFWAAVVTSPLQAISTTTRIFSVAESCRFELTFSAQF